MNNKKVLQKCLEIAQLSPCKKLKVGAVLRGKYKEKDIWGYDYNQLDNLAMCEPSCNMFLRNKDDWTAPTYLQHLKRADCNESCKCAKLLHAEMAALEVFDWGISNHSIPLSSINDLTLYSTHFPCAKCLKELINYGVEHIVMLSSLPNEEEDLLFLHQSLLTDKIKSVTIINKE